MDMVPPRLSKWSFPASLVSSRSFPASLVPPWCLAGCRSCLPGASLVPRRVSKMVLSCLPGTLQAVQLVLSCLPGASQAVPLVLSCLPGASLVLRRPSNWSESRFWTGAGFCLNFNTTSMANGLVRGKSWGGPHGRLQRRLAFKRPLGARVYL